MDLLTERSCVARRETPPTSPWHRLTQPSVIARDHRDPASLGFNGGHPEHLGSACRHHEDVGHVVDGGQATLLHRAEVPAPNLRDPVRPRDLLRLANGSTELRDGTRDHERSIGQPLMHVGPAFQEQIGPLLLIHPAHVEDDRPGEPEALLLGCPHVLVWMELSEVDPVVQDRHVRPVESPVGHRLLLAVAGTGEQEVERAKHALIEGVQDGIPTSRVVEVVIDQGTRTPEESPKHRPLGLTMERQNGWPR